jgi:uncharacterized damage-inducible protein DinB
MLTPTADRTTTGERAELLQQLTEQRTILLIAVRGLSDRQMAARSTVSDLTLGGIIRHLTQGERVWTQIMLHGGEETPPGMWDTDQYYLSGDETADGLLAAYEHASRATAEAVRSLDTLDRVVTLPEAPWAPGIVQRWSARVILLHLLRETAQHAGHADIIREALDGANTTAQLGT